MTTPQKRRWLQIALWSAGVLYAWGLSVLWFAHEWELSHDTFYVVGVLPSVGGVFALCAAIGLYVDLLEEEGEGD